MALLAWDESLETRIPHIDEQHRGLVKLINDLDQSLQEGTAGLLVSNVLQELMRYVKDHFEDEEQFMLRHAFPDLPAHRREHDLFVTRLKDIHANFLDGDALSSNILDFLKGWLVHHIRGTDQVYVAFINGTPGG